MCTQGHQLSLTWQADKNWKKKRWRKLQLQTGSVLQIQYQ